MNQKSIALVTIDLRLRYKLNLWKLLKWFLPVAVFAAKLLDRLNHAGP